MNEPTEPTEPTVAEAPAEPLPVSTEAVDVQVPAPESAPPEPVQTNPELLQAQEVITQLQSSLNGFRTIIGTILERHHGVLILKRSDREAFFQKQVDEQRPPIINVEQFGKNGDLRITSLWKEPAPQETPGPPYAEIAKCLTEAKEEIPAFDVVMNWSLEEKIDAIQWALKVKAKNSGLEIVVPERPDHF